MSSNGRLTAGELVTFQGVLMAPATRDIAARMTVDAARAGKTIGFVRGYPGYRSVEVQVGMRSAFARGEFNVAPYFLARNGVKPAVAGTSAHGYGTALDWAGSIAWLVQNMDRYGVTRPFGDLDPNHFLFPTSASAGGGTTPIPEDDMLEDEREALFAIKGALLDGNNQTGLDRGRLDVITESALRIRGAKTQADGSPNPEYQFGDVLQFIRSDLAAVARAIAAGGGGAVGDVGPVLAALDALDKQADSYQTSVLAVLADLSRAPNADEILATLGLQKIPS